MVKRPMENKHPKALCRSAVLEDYDFFTNVTGRLAVLNRFSPYSRIQSAPYDRIYLRAPNCLDGFDNMVRTRRPFERI